MWNIQKLCSTFTCMWKNVWNISMVFIKNLHMECTNNNVNLYLVYFNCEWNWRIVMNIFTFLIHIYWNRINKCSILFYNVLSEFLFCPIWHFWLVEIDTFGLSATSCFGDFVYLHLSFLCIFGNYMRIFKITEWTSFLENVFT